MNEEKNNSLPLYINEYNPFLLYIINNKVIMYEETPISSGYVHTAFYFLQELFDNKTTNHVFPKVLHKQFNELERKNLKFSKTLCFCGYPPAVDARYLNCLTMKMTINPENAPNIVRLSHFARIEESGKFVLDRSTNDALLGSIPDEIQLTASDAFILLGNINTIKFGITSGVFTLQDFSIIRERYINYYKNSNLSHMVQQYHAKLFCLDYLEFLAQQIILENLKPELILRLGGPNILASLALIPPVTNYLDLIINELVTNQQQLSFGKKIQYFLLLYFCNHISNDRFHLIKKFYAKNSKLMMQLKKELIKSSTSLDYKLVSWDDVYTDYF